MVVFDQKRYLFNCGEGFQRLSSEFRLRLSRVSCVFSTSTSWSCLGGVPGALLTLSDMGVSGMRVVGPPRTCAFLAGFRHFAHRPAFALHARDVLGRGEAFRDELLQVSAFPLCPSPPRSAPAAPPEFSRLVLDAGETGEDGNPFLPAEGAGEAAFEHLCYLLRFPDRPGRFSASRARELGVEGADRARLVRGESVVGGGGRTVTPTDVIAPGTPGALIAVLAVPSESHIEYLFRHVVPAMRAARPRGQPLRACFHLTSRRVLARAEYADAAAALGEGIEHVVVGDAAGRRVVFRRSAEMRARARAVLPRAFPLPRVAEADGIKSRNMGNAGNTGMLEIRGASWRVAQVGDRYAVEPPGDWQAEPARIEEDAAIVVGGGGDGDHERDVHEEEEERERDDLSVLFLGTGAMLPSKYRNVTSQLVRVGGLLALLDCGEGSLGQLQRAVGAAALPALLSRLGLVFLSHLHADHHLGTMRVLEAARELSPEISSSEKTLQVFPLLVGPRGFGLWLREMTRVVPRWACFRFLDWQDFAERARPLPLEGFEATMRCVGVEHCPEACAVRLDCGGRSLAYSGDCRPCGGVASLGAVDFLVHEATFEDGLEHEAKEKRHSTIGEACAVAHAMPAAVPLLTHFSQRYPKCPRVPEGAIAAVDFMEVTMARAAAMAELMPKLSEVFAEVATAEEEPPEQPTSPTKKKMKN